MATRTKSSKIVLLLQLFILLSMLFMHAKCTQHEVGGRGGRKTPNKSKHDHRHVFNNWASNHRFIVGDIIHFNYEKDSVMEVSEEEYEKCECSHPLFFSNNGDTMVELDHAGRFYFISGISGHCEKGQKMMIKVLDRRVVASTPLPSWGHNNSTSNSHGSSIKDLHGLISSFIVTTLVMIFV